MLVLVALPVAIGIGLTARYFVPLLLGPKWVQAVPVIEILVISGGLLSLASHVRPIYLALNRPKLGAYASIGHALVYLPALYVGLSEYGRSEEHTSELQSLMRISYAVFCLKKKKEKKYIYINKQYISNSD